MLQQNLLVVLPAADLSVAADRLESLDRCVRPVWITFQSYKFSVVAVFAVIYSKTAVNGRRLLLKSYPNCL